VALLSYFQFWRFGGGDVPLVLPIDGSDSVVTGSRNGGGGVYSLRERRGLQPAGSAGSGGDRFGEAWRRRGLAAAHLYAGSGSVDSLLSMNLVAFPFSDMSPGIKG
jgi:hypothetical protein